MRVPEPLRVMYGHLNWRALITLYVGAIVATAVLVAIDASPMLSTFVLAAFVGMFAALFWFSALEGVRERDARRRQSAHGR